MSDLESKSKPRGLAREDTRLAVTLDALRSEDLLRGRPQVAIRHGPETYYLRQTRFGKLILTK